MKRGIDILVGTPGRILDHMNRGNLNLAVSSPINWNYPCSVYLLQSTLAAIIRVCSLFSVYRMWCLMKLIRCWKEDLLIMWRKY